ncbi:BSD domain-containing protein 1-like, partial [Limulus polyphemus]|uniref:BSD domain-containing protein 1-like n=1 Tax=Limulus polyphemus TaxID=6850 RepID=A0ABM1BZY4_LIMPO
VDSTESMAGKAKEGITSLLENITEAFMPYQEPDEEEVMIIHNSEPLILDRWESQLHAIRVDPKTYCREPESPPEMYETWLEVFDLNAHQEEISKIMVECGQVRNLYAKLVPTAVSHNEFWQRYFFRVQQLKEAEIKRAELVQRANQQLPSDDLDWGDDDDFGTPSSPGGKKEREKSQMDNFGFQLESDKDNIKDVIISSSSKDESVNYASEEQKSLNGEVLKVQETTEKRNNINTPLESEKPVEDRASEQKSLKTSVISYSQEPCSQKKDIEKDPSKQTPCEPLNVDVSPDNHTAHDISNPVTSANSTDISGVTLTTKEKGDMVLVATGNSGPSPPSSDSTGKDCSTEEEWEKDFDLEVSDEDLKRAEEIAKQLAQSAGIFEDQDNWEDWE